MMAPNEIPKAGLWIVGFCLDSVALMSRFEYLNAGPSLFQANFLGFWGGSACYFGLLSSCHFHCILVLFFFFFSLHSESLEIFPYFRFNYP